MQDPIRATVYLDPVLHRALRLKAADLRCSMSDIVNTALRESLREDAEDLEAFETRIAEPEISYEALLKDLRKHGKL
jgi:hypothetical protein